MMDNHLKHLKQLILKVFERASSLVEVLEATASNAESLEEAAEKLRRDFSIYAALKNNTQPEPILENLAAAIQEDADEADFSGVEYLTELLEDMEDESNAEPAFRNAYLVLDTFSAYLNNRKASLN